MEKSLSQHLFNPAPLVSFNSSQKKHIVHVCTVRQIIFFVVRSPSVPLLELYCESAPDLETYIFPPQAPPFSPMCYCNIPTNLDSSTLLLVTHTIHTKLYLLYSLHWIRLRLALIPTRFLTPSILWSMIHLDLDIEMCQRLVPSFSPCTDAILPHRHPVCVICTQIIANN